MEKQEKDQVARSTSTVGLPFRIMTWIWKVFSISVRLKVNP